MEDATAREVEYSEASRSVGHGTGETRQSRSVWSNRYRPDENLEVLLGAPLTLRQ
jgi:hypothetical protein